ncbi:MAG: copper homeostasis protein CutC [Hungatella sp.]|nr:copper homeostasis protein CutC [Hungatella sp.]
MRTKLEVCVDSAESAISAQEGGADCLEVCANLIIGGTTPGVSQFKQIRKMCGIELNVLIRPRFGDFLYTDAEFQMVKEDIEMFREMGADGVVAGCLKADGDLDLDRIGVLREYAGPLRFTLHRAFDVCRNPYRALEEAVSLGIDRILTSGQASCCLEGRDVLKKLMVQADERIEILVGGGVNEKVIRQIIEDVRGCSFHMSGKKVMDSGMRYRKQGVNMGLPGLSEFGILRTDREEIEKARAVINTILPGGRQMRSIF